MLNKDVATMATQAGFQIKTFGAGDEIGVDGGVVFLTLTNEVARLVLIAKAHALREASSMLDGGTAAARMLARMAEECEDEAYATTGGPSAG